MIRMITPIALLLMLSVVTNAQVVTCKYSQSSQFCHDLAGPYSCIIDYHYVCSDGHSRKTIDGAHKEYACQGLDELFYKIPDCTKEMEKYRKLLEKRKREEQERLRLEKLNNDTKIKSAEASEKVSKKIVEANSNYIVDERDGKKYRTVSIGNQTWMAENMNYEMDGSICPLPLECEKTGLECDEKKACEKYGRLYSGKEALDACPSGWRLSNDDDVKNLFSITSKSTPTLLVKDWGSSDEYGFSILPLPTVLPTSCIKKDFGRKKCNGYFGPVANFWKVGGMWDVSPAGSLGNFGKHEQLASVRCILEESDKLSFELGEMIDPRDKKKYKTLKIGKQEWMAENLNYSKLGECFQKNQDNCDMYGRVYTWKDAKRVCPSGWHLPDKREWEQLFIVAGGKDSAAKKLKSAKGWDGWSNGSDDFGFSVKPAGYYEFRGYQEHAVPVPVPSGNKANFWSSEYDLKMSNIADFGIHNDAYVLHGDKRNSYSVRCVNDKNPVFKQTMSNAEKNNSLAENNIGVLFDERDGTKYKTVKIGNLEWMAENLNYGDSIQTPTLAGKSWSTSDFNEKYNGSFYLYDISRSRIYTRDAAMQACPNGWHLPNNEEWMQLIAVVKSKKLDANALVSKNIGWSKATNALGFSAISSGFERNNSNNFVQTARSISFWSASMNKTPNSDDSNYELRKHYYVSLNSDESSIKLDTIEVNFYYIGEDKLRRLNSNMISEYSAFPIRCVKDGGVANGVAAKANFARESEPATESSSHEACKAAVAKAKNTYNRCVTLPKGSAERSECTKRYKEEKEDASKACIIRQKN